MFIQELVGILFRKLNHTYSCVSEDLVGMDSSMEEMIKLLGLGMDDARVVGIWGMGGIGKTTLASAIYAHISCQFEDYSFIENVREVSEKGGLKTLHEQLISKILMEKDLKVGNIGSALSTIRNRVCRKKVHIVVDDVDESTELEKLVGELDWFGFGREDEAIKLFKSKAFRKHQQMGGYGELVHCAVKYAKGVPLALKVLDEWESTSNRLKESPLNEVQKVLREKDKNDVLKILESCDFHPIIGIKILVEKSLTTISDNKLMMHDLIQELGWNIVCQESPKEPRQRKDLKYLSNKLRYLDWCRYPMKCMPSSFQPAHLVELHLTYSSIEQLWEGTMYPDFTTFPNLERLILEGCAGLVNLDPSIGILRRLICLNLKDCKILNSLPSDIQLETIVVLNVSGCSKVENISVNFGYMKCLSELDLDGIGVSELPPSIEHLANLVLLSLSNSKKLRSIPDNICQLKALSSLNVSGCSKLDKLPQYMGALDCLKDLHLDQTAIRQLPSSIGLLKKLKTLSLEGFLGIVFVVVGIKNESKCCKCYSIEVGFKGPGIQMTSGESHKNELAYFQYLNARNVAVIYVPLNGIPGSMKDDMGQLHEGGIEFQACLVREGHDFDGLTKAFDEDFSLIEGDVKLGVHLVYKEEADEEVWRIIDSSDTEDNNMSVFHGDLDRSVGRAGVEVASFSATTSKRRRGDLNDNHYNAAVGSSGCGKFDDQKEEDNLNSKRPKQAGPSECGNFD
ncbi:hypothetical protein ACSBR2_039785 [Camellia fascicularis]